ncbi:MAG: DUF2950 domain-containing protein [Deltaproteobacteria bacterium]|nr:DUF2950 domain-containing protein [Deltaproteobacteria bacterium]
MFLCAKNGGKPHRLPTGLAVVAALSLTAISLGGSAIAASRGKSPSQQSFPSPQEAVAALASAVKADNLVALSAILGPESKEIISSGDDIADKQGRERFVSLFEQKNGLKQETDRKAILTLGNDDWPFPIPLVKANGGWVFDTRAGKEEILNRRIGRNELSAIQTCLAYVDAQREYASKDRDGDGVLEYAQKFASASGKKDGLYWEAAENEERSPLGPLAARARKEGYPGARDEHEAAPYHGYYYRILKAQGRHAPDGAYEYTAGKDMIGGFALIAYPAQYGSSGVMTFMVSHHGDVYEKDLGRKTSAVAQSMRIFDPDKTWRKVEPKYLECSSEAHEN